MSSYKYLGWGITDEHGVAHLDHDSEGQEISHSYVGVGAGEIDVVASLDNPVVEGSIVSEPLSVLDTLLYDTGTDATHNIWTGDTSNLTRGSEYSRLEESTIGTMASINATMPTGLWVLTMTVKRDGLNGQWDINILNNNVSVFGCGTPANDVWTDIKIIYDGSKIYYFENGSTTPTKTTSVVLDDSKTTTLKLQTPQDITYLDFKDLIVLREEQSVISITSSNPIIQTGDTSAIKGSLYDDGVLVKNATLDVYKNGTKVGTTSTGDSGVASYTYTGTGAGATEFQFRYGSILSETYTIIDGQLLVATDSFTGSSGDHDYYLSGQGLYSWNAPLCVEFDVESITNPQYMRFRVFERDGIPAWVRDFNTLNVNNSAHIKIIATETGTEWFVDGVSKYTTTGTVENPLRIGFSINGGETSINIKNLVIYPI